MKLLRIPIAVLLLILPMIARTIWFYQGVYVRAGEVATPDYPNFVAPTPPLSTAEPNEGAPADSGRIILIDQAHNNNFSMSDLEGLTKRLRERGARFETVESSRYSLESPLAWQLKYASAYVAITPLAAYSPQEVQLLREFAGRGGRILALADPTRGVSLNDVLGLGTSLSFSDVDASNSLLAPFDLAFSEDYLYNMTENEGNFQNVVFQTFPDAALTDGLSKVVLYVCHSITTKTGTPLLVSAKNTLSSRTESGNGLSAAALDSTGNVLAIGDLSFLSPPYYQVADNSILIDHVTDFLLTSSRVHTLSDFPFVFTRPVIIVPAKDVELTTDLLSPLNALQSALESAGTKASINTKTEDGKDLILLETYSSKDINELVKPFQITLPNLSLPSSAGEGSKILLPGLGPMTPIGTGLILFSHDSSHTSLILVAEDASALSGLLDVLGSVGFKDCLLQGDIGVCATSSMSSSPYFNSLFRGGGGTSSNLPNTNITTPTHLPVGRTDR
jgi:hypothetical protein